MIDKKTFVLAVAVSWALTLVTVLLISNFAPSLTQPFTQQFTESNSVKVVTFTKQGVQNISSKIEGVPEGFMYFLDFNFTWTPSNPNNNNILVFICSFEYKINTIPQTNWNLDFDIRVNRFHRYIQNGLKPHHAESEDWQTASFTIVPNTHETPSENWINPNQLQYPIRLNFNLMYSTSQTLIRNVNLMLLVVDG